MWKVAGAAVLVVVAAATACNAVEGDAPEAATSEIQGGDPDPDHPWAVGIYHGDENGGGVCSGSLIAPNLVLTARHCVAPSPHQIDCRTATFGSSYAADSFMVTTRARLQGGPQSYDVVKVVTPAEAQFCGNDIALLVLSRNVPDAEAHPVAPAVNRAISDHSAYTGQITAIGYGRTSPSGPSDSGLRRIKQHIPIRCIPGDPQLPCDPAIFRTVHPREFIVGQGTCSGDSGSGAFEQASFNRGQPITLGVLSRGPSNATTCLDPTYTRNDVWSALIIDTAIEAATLGNYPEPAWVDGPPSVPDAGVPDAGPIAPRPDGGLDAGKPDAAPDAAPPAPKDAGTSTASPGATAEPDDDDEPEAPKKKPARAPLPPLPDPAPKAEPLPAAKSGSCAAAPGESDAGGATALIALGAIALVRRRRRAR